MLTPLTSQQKNTIESIINRMSPQEKAAQVLAWHFGWCTDETPARVADMLDTYPLGSIFFSYGTVEQARKMLAVVNEKQKGFKAPVVITADLVNGAGARIDGALNMPAQMALGATDSEELAEKMGVATAIEGRWLGFHWTFSPIVDLNVNFNNPMMHTRSFGEDQRHVTRMSRAYIRGIQKDGLLAASAKHFPGDGIDDRDSHVCTSINSLSEQEWMETYGYVWKEVIDEGVMAVMPGHIALPWIDPGTNYLGPPPATYSEKIQIELLRDRLGFQGAVVSDALPMIGYSGFVPTNDRAAGNIRCGSDLVLYSKPERDVPQILKALEEGRLSNERLDDAVRKNLELKMRIGLFDEDFTPPEMNAEHKKTFEVWSDEIGDRSITIVRDAHSTLPLKLSAGAKVLTVSCQIGDDKLRGLIQDLQTVDEELSKRGFEVRHVINPAPLDLRAMAEEVDAVFMNINVPPRYGTTRFYGKSSFTFWDSFWHEHPATVFTSFGDPYKIYEMPYVPNMVLAFSNAPSSQRAAVKVWLGEMEAGGKNPVKLDGFFDLQV